jgi:protein TonB
VAHIALFAVVALVKARPPAASTPEAAPVKTMSLVWAPKSGGGSPKGTGGEETLTKPTPAQLVGTDAVTVPAAPPPQLEPSTLVETPTPRLDIPVVPVANGIQEAVGAIAEVSLVNDFSRGPGGGLGVGGKTGDGNGDRDGDRIGNGNRGPGQGDEFTPGNGVSWPRLVQEVKPNYTADAMRAQVQGYVELEITVLADGSVGRVHIVRSLDPRFGLDEEAIKAVRRWRFDPGRKLGRAVATRVGVELAFHLR